MVYNNLGGGEDLLKPGHTEVILGIIIVKENNLLKVCN